jgi:hypothetical protein
LDATIATAVAAAADLGACSTTGMTATASTGGTPQQADAGLGSCTTTGLTATITAAVTATADLGACTTTGLTATVATAVAVTADLGACTTTGLTATASTGSTESPTEFVCRVVTGGNENDGVFASPIDWHTHLSAINGGDYTSTRMRVYSISGSTGDMLGEYSDGTTVTGGNHSYTATVIWCTSTQIAVFHSDANTFEASEVLTRSSGNTVTVDASDGGGDVIKLVLEVDGEVSISASFGINAFVLSSTNKLIIRPYGATKVRADSGDLRYGTARGRIYQTGASARALYVIASTSKVNYVEVEDMDFATSASTNQCVLVSGAQENVLIMRRCLVRSQGTGAGTATLHQNSSHANSKIDLDNCIVYGDANKAFLVSYNTCTARYSVFASTNATFSGVETATGTTFVGYNCYSHRGSTSGSAYTGAGTETLNYCASSDATGSPVGLQGLAADDQFVTLTGGSEDFHLESTADLIDAGTTVSGLAHDIFNVARPAGYEDVGAVEYDSGALQVTASLGTCTTTGLTATVATAVAVTADAGACTTTGLTATAAVATMRYIRAGATGANDGTSWTDAWTDFPTDNDDWVRGYTYYVADGSYGAHTFSKPVSGSTYITIKKATASDHGTETGWDSGYGDGQAVFDAPILFQTSYWVFDGVVGGGPGAWTTGYGFYVRCSTAGSSGLRCVSGMANPSTNAVEYITVRHTDTCYETNSGGNGAYTGQDNFYWWRGNHITMSYCGARNAGRCHVLTHLGSYTTAEYCNFYRNDEYLLTEEHAQSWQDDGTGYITIRHCRFLDCHGTGYIVAMVIADDQNPGWEIYGNVFKYGDHRDSAYDFTDGVIAIINDADATNWKVYNNTFIGPFVGSGPESMFWSTDGMEQPCGHEVYNNLVYNQASPTINWATGDTTSVHDYNHWQSCTGTPTEDHDTSGSGDPFTNASGDDYTLTEAIGDGVTLLSPYDVDGYGITRGDDGTWDCGAYEFEDTGAVTAQLGSCTTTGLTATVSTAVTVTAELGSCTTTGLTATIATGSPQEVTAALGVCTTTGKKAAAVRFTRPIVIDHTAVDMYNAIPQSYIDLVKCMLFNCPGESHSSGYTIGTTLLAAQDARFPVTCTSNSEAPTAYQTSALRVARALRVSSSWTSCGEEEWFTNATGIQTVKDHITYCESNSRHISAILFGWCWDMCTPNLPGGTADPVYGCRWAGASVSGPEGSLRWGLDAEDYALTYNTVCLDTYLAATVAYEAYCIAQGLTTKVVYVTGPCDSYDGENGYQRHLKQERIRAYVAADPNEARILFDMDDILSWSDDDEQNILSWSGHNYAHIHDDNMLDIGGGYTEDGDHIGQVGALRVAKAVWVLMARLAGWGGTVEVAQLGAATTTGLDATVSTAVTVVADLGACSTTGLDATASAGDTPQQVTAGLGTCSTTGLTATVATAVAVPAQLGTATTTGLTATVVVEGEVTAALGVCSTTGLTASVSTAVSVTAALGACSTTGLDATVVAEYTASAQLGSCATTGLTATVTAAVARTAELGACGTTGLAASITAAITRSAELGVATTTGLTATIIATGPPQTVVAALGVCTTTGFLAAANVPAPKTILVANSRLAGILVANSRMSSVQVANSRGATILVAESRCGT